MEKTLEKFSNVLENLLRNNKSILNERDDLLYYMFGGIPFEDKINELFSRYSYYDYFFIGKILFFTDIKNISDSLLKNKNDLIKLLKDEKYLIIKEDFKIEDLENRLSSNKKIHRTNSSTNLESKDEWSLIFDKIKILDVTIKSKDSSSYFNFDDTINMNFKLSEIVTEDFEQSCKVLFESKSSNYKNNKLENALFLNNLSKILKNRTDLDKIIGISKDKISDFKIIASKSNQDKNWDNLSWADIKKLKEINNDEFRK